MSRHITIPASETDRLRLFALNLSEHEAEQLVAHPEGLSHMLGGASLDHDYVEILRFADVAAMGLGQYLAEGYAVDTDVLAGDADRLGKLDGYGVIILSSAFQSRPAELVVGAKATLICDYGLPETSWQDSDVPPPESAKPYSAPPAARKKQPSNAAMSGRIAMVALLVMALLTFLMIWIA